MKAIVSDANPSFRRWLKTTAQPRTVRSGGRTLAEGIHLAQAACEAGAGITALLLRRSAGGADVTVSTVR